MIRRLLLIVTVVAVAGVSAGCGGPDRRDVEDLRAALARTERQAHRFEYLEEELITGRENRVVGVVEDDFRYRVRLEVDGQPAVDEVVYDDAVADRFFNTETLRAMLRKTPAEAAKTSATDLATPQEVGAALRAGKWVLDPVGAPPMFAAVDEERQLGDDPIVDAQSVFQYVERIARTQPVKRFNEDDLDYKPKEDPFPKPSKDSDVVRYDFFRFPVPKPSEGAASGRQAVPGAPSFRKMSVYVKDGLVIRILEVIDVVDRLDDIERNYDVKLEGDTKAQVKTAIDAINAVRRGQGERESIRVRKLDFRLLDIGQEQSVALPNADVKGSLVMLANRGKAKTGASSSSDPAAAAEDATATTTAP